MFQLIRLPNVTGNGADGLLTVECPIGYKYKEIYLPLVAGTCTSAMITQAQVLMNGQAVWDITGPNLDDINQVDAFTAFGTSKVLRFPFSLPRLTDDRLSDLTAVNTGQVSPVSGKVIHTFQIRLTLLGTTGPNFEAYALVENSTAEGPGVIRRFHRYGFASTAGETGYNTLDFGTTKDALIRRAFVLQSVGTVSRLRWTADTREVFNSPTAVITEQLKGAGFVPGSVFGAISDFAGAGRGYLPEQNPFMDTLGISGKSLTFYVTNSLAGSNTVLLENIGEV